MIKAIVTKFIKNINLGLYVGRFGLRDVVDVTHRTVSGLDLLFYYLIYVLILCNWEGNKQFPPTNS